jgi:hypothetical protein
MIDTPTYVPFAWDDGVLVKRKVIQCALSRICGGCGLSLGRPIAFLGDEVEVGRNAFHTPPQHAACAERTRALLDPSWQVVLTAGFEFVRPARDDLDQQLRFEPNSLL